MSLAILGAITGGAIQAIGAAKAAKTQAQTADKALAYQKDIYTQTRNDLAPTRATGSVAQQVLASENGLGPAPMIGGTAPQIETIAGRAGGVDQAAVAAAKRTMDSIGGTRAVQAYQAALAGTKGTAPTYRVNGQTFATLAEAQAYANANMTGGTPYRGAAADPQAITAPTFAEDPNKKTPDNFAYAPQPAPGDPAAAGGVAQPGSFSANLPHVTSATFAADPMHKTSDSFTTDPGYQFRLAQGLDAVQSSAASRGNLLSGSAVQGVNDYAQGQASQAYGDWYNRLQAEYANWYNANQSENATWYNRLMGENNTWYNRKQGEYTNYYNRLAGLADAGMKASGDLAAAGSGYAANAGTILGQKADAQSAGYVGVGNAINGGISNALSAWRYDNPLAVQKNTGGYTYSPFARA